MTAQILSVLAMIAMVLSYQMKERRQLLLLQILSNLLFAVSYALLGAKSGAVMSGINAVRCWVFSKKDTAWGSSRIWLYVFLAAALIGGIFGWESPLSLLVILPTLLLTVALYSSNMKFMRRIFLILPLLYISYNVMSRSIGGIGNDIFCLISAAVAVWRFDIRKETPAEK